MYLSMLADDLADPCEPGPSAELGALAADLRFAAGRLASLGDRRRRSGRPVEKGLSRQVERWSAELAKLVRSMETILGGPEEDR